jgi:hypothetical protein
MAICTGTPPIHTTVLCSLSTPSQSHSFGLAPFFSSSLSTYNMYCHLCQKSAMEDSFHFCNNFDLNTNTLSSYKPFNSGACLQISSICDGQYQQAVTGNPKCLFMAYSWQGISSCFHLPKGTAVFTTGPSWTQGISLPLSSG